MNASISTQGESMEVSEGRLVLILSVIRTYETVAKSEAPLYPELKAAFAELVTLRSEIQHANEALAACQSQARGRIRELVDFGYELAGHLEGVTQDERDRIETTAGMLQSEWFRRQQSLLDRASKVLWPDGKPNPHLREPFQVEAVHCAWCDGNGRCDGVSQSSGEPATPVDRKIAARDLHYTLVEQYGLKDDPVSNATVRKGLERLAGLSGEPGARPEPAAYLIYFDDAEREDEVFMLGGNAEAAARHRFEQVLGRGWNAHLFQRIDDGKRPAGQPPTKPALPAEQQK